MTSVAFSTAFGVRLSLPWPPSVNTYWRSVPIKTRRGRTNRVMISRRGREYRKAVAKIVQEARLTRQLRGELAGNLDVALWLAPPDKRGRDIDNYQKALFDALTHAGVWADDSQIKRLAVEWCQPQRHGGVVMAVEPIYSSREILPDVFCI